MNLAARLKLPEWPVISIGLLTAVTIVLAATFVSKH
jgi:hypothetical protein